MRPSRDLGRSGSRSTEVDQERARAVLKDAALLLLGREPDNVRDYDALGRRLGAAVRGKRYSTWYVRNLLMGYQPISPTAYAASKRLLNLLTEGRGEDGRGLTTVVQAVLAEGVHVKPNALILASSRPCICGVEFIPKTPNQVYHRPLCARLARRMG